GLACAVPVVASDISGYRAVLEGDVGILFPPGDHEALATAVVELLGDEESRRRRGAAGRALVEERYAWTSIAARLLEIYEEGAALGPAAFARRGCGAAAHCRPRSARPWRCGGPGPRGPSFPMRSRRCVGAGSSSRSV